MWTRLELFKRKNCKNLQNYRIMIIHSQCFCSNVNVNFRYVGQSRRHYRQAQMVRGGLLAKNWLRMFSFLNNPRVWFGHTIWGGFSNINCNQDIRILSRGKISVLGRRAIHPRRRARWTTNHQKAIPQRIEICI